MIMHGGAYIIYIGVLVYGGVNVRIPAANSSNS